MKSAGGERKVILLLCLLGAVHTFIFSAAFPFFNNVDEHAHFDLVTKYAGGRFPRGLEPLASAITNYFVLYDSHAFYWPANQELPTPSWSAAAAGSGAGSNSTFEWWPRLNYETGQPPLYYLLAGAWWQLGRACGWHGGQLLYWLRFLNVLFVGVLVWLGYLAGRLIFPENILFRIGVPAMIAVFPQTSFYSIQNDVLSPLAFGGLLILLVKFYRAEVPGGAAGVALGSMFAVTFLAKLTNVPFMAVAGVVVVLKLAQLFRAGRLRLAMPAIVGLGLCACLPAIAWMAWCRQAFGDFTGAGGKVAYLGWTVKPFAQWWHHPIFTLNGAWTFLSMVVASFWEGEFWWHGQPLSAPAANAIYVIGSLSLMGLAVWGLLSKRMAVVPLQRQAIWFCLATCAAGVAFLGLNSIMYDFHECFCPSRAVPYLTAGRMLLGAMIPVLMLCCFGLEYLLHTVKKGWVRPALIAVAVLFSLAGEIAIDWPVFFSRYNWFHM